MLDLTDAEIDKIFRGVYTGKINPENLPQDLYAAIAEKLKDGLYKGYGGSLKSVESSFGYGSAPAELLKNLRENIYLFAGAKTFHQTEEMRGLLVENGKVVTYDVFKKRAKETYSRYNENWMQAEYITAVGQAESARQWVSIEDDKHLFPYLRYIAVMDANTSTICAPLNGITLHVDDPFWNKFSPLNHYRCRCVREQLEKEDATISGKDKVKKATDAVDPKIGEGFNMNPGKSGEVFGKDHPYFKEVPEKYKDLASENFNLPIPEAKKFNPALTLKEAEDRIMKLGVRKADLKGLKIDYANSVLSAIESEAEKAPLNLDNVKTFKKKNSNAKAFYAIFKRDIEINLSHTENHVQQVLASWDQQIKEIEAIKKRFKDDFLGNEKYNQADIRSRIRKLDWKILDIQAKIKAGEEPKYWSMSMIPKEATESLFNTMIHEIGHHRDFELRSKRKMLPYNFDKKLSPTDYGATNKEEYFTEWYTKYRIEGSEGVPDDLMIIFNLIDGK